ncbi:histidine kinase dimerization/phospho-acceptor domain-containing protein [Aquimarina sp. RZ0]|uniref:sensor histidine kinase n=1 Tax=Aquimarina sp. RZ0 TaxID=2607730 RepID=UPI0011F27421|nr:histidine kinase dimerization/phospho-acceptor domain-containing protein [Aquimarina sp. RZ0]KAA1245998.1 PAS domain S-box protein [Aquimarina sp. RZ0]
MDTINFYQLSIFLLQGFVVSLMILVLFHLRKIFGFGLLYTTIGMFQFMQVFMASTVYFEISKDMLISPGSSILFSASLFTILLFYIKEDATITRRLIYGLVIANIALSILLVFFRINIEGANMYNTFNISIDFFNTNVYILFFGTFMLFVDSILIIFVFEFISKYISNLFLRICLTMILILGLDAIIFSLGSFWNSENLQNILLYGIVSKGVAAIYFSILFTIYLRYFQQDIYDSKYATFKDVYHSLTYRQKLEEAEKVIQISENRYQTLTDISPVGVFMTEANGKTTFVNKKWCEISGLSYEEALDDGWLDAVHPEDREKLKSGWYDDAGKRDSSHAKYRFLRSDGTIKWVLGQAIPEYNEKNQIIGYVGTTTDITELKLYEIELNKMKDKAEESDRLKSAFLANMSHEIRTPMNGIMGFAELLKEPVLTGDEQKLYIDLIEESGARMLNIIRDIIDISKIESGQVKIFLSDVNINEQVEYLYHFFKPEADRKELQLSFCNSLENELAIIKTDKEKFNAILTNLVKNAIKYTHEGSISFGYQKKGEFLQFFIKDTGIGIAENRQKAIFERFVQADIHNNYAIEGAGIGLSIAKAFTEILEGKIWLKSIKDTGSTFYFTIPYVKQ